VAGAGDAGAFLENRMKMEVAFSFKLSRLKGHCCVLPKTDFYHFDLFGLLRTSPLNSPLLWEPRQRSHFRQEPTRKQRP
jgi:hypothetical protein